jgi:hypothetical protein
MTLIVHSTGTVYKMQGCYPRPMKKIKVLLIALLLTLVSSPGANAVDTCASINTPAVADDALTVTLSLMTVTEKLGSNQLSISYKLLNATSDKKIDEGSFKLFFVDGSSEPQYGAFGTFFPGDSRERSYTWEYLKSKTPMLVSYNAGFFSTAPSALKLNWVIPGQTCKLSTPAPATPAPATPAPATQPPSSGVTSNDATDAINKLVESIEAQNKAVNDAVTKVAEKLAATKKASGKAKAKSKTITCNKGKESLKVTGAKPICPSGYKKK